MYHGQDKNMIKSEKLKQKIKILGLLFGWLRFSSICCFFVFVIVVFTVHHFR